MEVRYAKQSASVMMPEGYSVVVPIGTHWSANDPVVLAHPDLFSDDPRWGMYGRPPELLEPPPVEQATAAPGERRNVRRG